MWSSKGILLGIGLFFIGTILYVYLMIRSGSAQATGITAIFSWTLMNLYYWLAFVVALILGCVIVRYWPRSTR